MTKYLGKEPFSTPPASEAYRSNWDATFRPGKGKVIVVHPPGNPLKVFNEAPAGATIVVLPTYAESIVRPKKRKGKKR